MSSKRIPGRKNPKAIELGTIGEIKNGKYIEIRKEPRKSIKTEIRTADIKDFGEVALAEKAGKELLDDLNMVFDEDDAKKIYVISLLRASYPGIADRDLKFMYETSYLSELYPGVSLSENTITNFLMNMGRQSNLFKKFMEGRLNASIDDVQIIDGTLKSNDSITNDYSAFSRKGRIKGREDISIITSYSLQKMEPIASKVYSGNTLDINTITDFMDYCNLKKSDKFEWKEYKDKTEKEYSIPTKILIGDKGFSSESVMQYLEQRCIPYLLPLKVDSKYISAYNMDEFVGTVLPDKSDGVIFYKKVKTEDGRFLYGFRDSDIEKTQKQAYVLSQTKKNTYDAGRYTSKLSQFGLIVFISNVDMQPDTTYFCYKNRWDIEPLFSLEKNILYLDTVNVQGNYRLYASEFINFLTSIIGCRIKKIFLTTVLREIRPNMLDESELSKSELIDLVLDDEPDTLPSRNDDDNSSSKKTTKKKKSTKKIYVADAYSYPEVLKHLSKCKCVKNDSTGTWSTVITIKYIEELVNVLEITKIK